MRPCSKASCASLRRFASRETFMNLSSRTRARFGARPRSAYPDCKVIDSISIYRILLGAIGGFSNGEWFLGGSPLVVVGAARRAASPARHAADAPRGAEIRA